MRLVRISALLGQTGKTAFVCILGYWFGWHGVEGLIHCQAFGQSRMSTGKSSKLGNISVRLHESVHLRELVPPFVFFVVLLLYCDSSDIFCLLFFNSVVPPPHLCGPISRAKSIKMSIEIKFPRSEPYSVWERKYAFKPGFPYSDPTRRYWCLKHNCNFIFSSLGRVAQHEKFAHSRHPLTGDFGDWFERLEDEEEADRLARIMPAKEIRIDSVQNTMMRIGMNFFERKFEPGKL